MIHIWLFFQHLPPYPGAGSLRAQSIVNGLRSILLPSQGEITVLTSTLDSNDELCSKIIAVPAKEVPNTSGVLARVVGEIVLGVSAARLLPSKLPQHYLLVISTPAYLSALILSWTARRRNITYIVELRDIYPQVYAGSGLISQRSLLYRAFAALSRGMYNNAALTLAATKGLAREISKDAPSANVRHVYNGFPAKLAEMVSEKHSRFTVCFHGVMGYFQNIQGLIDLAEALLIHNIDLVVIGYGSQSSLAQACKLPNFFFLGKLSFDDTIAEIARCHIGISLRKNGTISEDAFPVKVWEYLGLGLPTIVTPHCEAGTFLDSHGCGWQFKADEIDIVKDKIVELATDPDAMDRITSHCVSLRMDYTRETLGRDAAQLIMKQVPTALTY